MPHFKVRKSTKLRSVSKRSGKEVKLLKHSPQAAARAANTGETLATKALVVNELTAAIEEDAPDLMLPLDMIVAPEDTLTPTNVFTLDDGTIVAVSFTAKVAAANMLSCLIQAWVVGADGLPILDAKGKPVVIEFKHNAPPHEVSAYGADGIAATLLHAVLGETLPENPAIRFSFDVLNEMNIRAALAAANASGKTVDLSTVSLPDVPAPPVEP